MGLQQVVQPAAAKTESKTMVWFPSAFPWAGASFIVNYNTRVGIEFVWNVTFTDHLDDVSGTYADPASFVGDASQDLSRDMQFVLSQPANPTVAAAAGIDNPEAYLNSFRWDAAYESPRGNPDKNDYTARCN